VPLPGPPLPVDAALDDLQSALARGHAVLTAPPGSGKTTRVPLFLRAAPWLDGAGILMLEPRRPAARMAAARMADLLGEAVGECVGYQIRFERRRGPRTRVEVVTEGILTRRLQSDPMLPGVGLLIFDEFHERSLQADLGLALALDLAAALRPDLRLLIMSATLDTAAVSRLLHDAPVISAPGRSFPVEVNYAERDPGDPLVAMEQAVQQALATRDGDLLAFLPGAREIERLRGRLAARLGTTTEVLPLHGSLPAAEQHRALVPVPGGPRRVVLATDLAETSVTIEGVTTVIDGGLTRKPRYHAGSGLTRLVIEPIPLAAAEQRAGRAGRLGPGVCYRLWTRAQEVGRAPYRRPEILDADLAPLALELALWGVRDPGQLRWLDPPPAPAWAAAVSLLKDLDALDERGLPTVLGRRLAEWPLHPRLGLMLAAAPAGPGRRLAADLAALLSEPDGWRAAPGQGRPADLGLRLAALDAFRTGRPARDVERTRLAAVERLSRRLTGAVGPDQSVSGVFSSPGELLARAYPDRICQRRGGPGSRYLLAAGTGAELPTDDDLAGHPYLVAAELDARGRDARIQLALPIAEDDLRRVLAGHLRTDEVLAWDDALEAVTARREVRLGALVLESRPLPAADPERTLALLLEQVEHHWERALTWDPVARQFQARVALLRRQEPTGDWPDLGDETLRRTLGQWLAPWLAGSRGLAAARALRLVEVLGALLAPGARARLDALAPETLTTPAGNRRRLDYLVGPEPVLPVPVQELFGARDTPCICGGRVPVMLHLLSPAGRPVQVTRDLAGFWVRGYPEVRRELRGRYPKHAWPEDPLAAVPVTRARGAFAQGRSG
jgi:ATP-dependent helicase HrpB